MDSTSSLGEVDALITVASWEERFTKGFNNLVRSKKPTRVLAFYFEEYYKWSEQNVEGAKILCESLGVAIETVALSMSEPGSTWKKLNDWVMSIPADTKELCLDITTMPRETIWELLYIIKQRLRNVHVTYTYYKPGNYGDWLSAEPGRPRLVYRMSGIIKLGTPTTLLILTGFDVDRTKRLVRMYEPQQVILGLQIGEQFGNEVKNIKKHKEAFTRDKKIIMFEGNQYDPNEIKSKIVDELTPFKNTNIVLSSLGPKPGAIGIYKAYVSNPELAISYAPSGQYNKEYSEGLGDLFEGEVT